MENHQAAPASRGSHNILICKPLHTRSSRNGCFKQTFNNLWTTSEQPFESLVQMPMFQQVVKILRGHSSHGMRYNLRDNAGRVNTSMKTLIQKGLREQSDDELRIPLRTHWMKEVPPTSPSESESISGIDSRCTIAIAMPLPKCALHALSRITLYDATLRAQAHFGRTFRV